MTAIVFNLQSLATSEYDWSFNSLTEQHAASDGGLMKLAGDDDAGQPIGAEAVTPIGLHKSSLRKGISMLYVSTPMPVVQNLDVLVVPPSGVGYAYPLQAQSQGVARAKPGRGIRESYLGFGVRNVAGADFEIERIEAQIEASATRRV